MSFFIIFLLSIVQGLTEFLPVSSSGHLAIIKNILTEIPKDSLILEISLHLGTLLSVIIYYRKKIILLLKSENKSFKLTTIIIAIIPAVLSGVIFHSKILLLSNSLTAVAIFLLITALFLFSCRKKQQQCPETEISFFKALIIGLFQALALFPGISRSGITIASALHLKINKQDAADFSFIMAIPLIAGAFVYELLTTQQKEFSFSFGLLSSGIFLSALFGLAAIYIVNRMVSKNIFHHFSWYCLSISVIAFFLSQVM